MSEGIKGLMMLEQRYGLTKMKRETINEGKSLYENVIDVGITHDKQNSLSKKHALSSERGLDYSDRGLKDIKTFNSHMPDIYRKLDFYFSEENKFEKPSELEADQHVDYIKEDYKENPMTEDEENKLRKEFKKQNEKEFSEEPNDRSKLKSGKGKSVFAGYSIHGDKEYTYDDSSDESKKESIDSSDESIEDDKNNKPSREQENTFKEFVKGDINPENKRYGLLIINRQGEIQKHYKSITEFKDDKENYNKFNQYQNNVHHSKRQIGVSFINDEEGDALYFVPLKSYREHYQTMTYKRRNKKKKKEEDEKNN